MLQSIRDKIEGWLATVILGLITIPFALWGINSYFEGDSKISIGSVDGVKISADTYRKAFEQQRRAAQKALGKVFQPSMVETPDFKTHVVEQLAYEMLVTKKAHVEGYRIADSQLSPLIKQDPAFQREGKFDQAMYQAILRRSGMDALAFEASLRDEFTKRQFSSGYGESALVTDAELKTVISLLEQKREISYVTFEPEKFYSNITIKPQDIEAYYQANPQNYSTPERVRIEYLLLSSAELAKKVKVSEEDIRKAYQDDIRRFSTPEERRASHILLNLAPGASPAEQQKVAAKLEDIRKQALTGTDFAKLAKQHSEDPGSAGNGGDLGVVERGFYPPAFEQAVYALKAGEISQPVRTADGLHLVKITALKPEVRKSFNEVRATIEEELRKRRADDQFFDMAERLRTVAYEQADSLKPAAQALDLKIQQSEWFTRDSGKGITADPKVVEAAFDPELRAQGRNSNAIDLSDLGVLVIRVLEHQPVALKPLADVRAGIEQLLKKQSAASAAARAGEEFVAKLNTGGEIAALAKQTGVALVAPKPFTRYEPKGVDALLVEAVFKASRPDGGKPVYGGAELTSGAYAVFALQRVNPGDIAQADPKIKERARQILTERRGQGLYQDYRRTLRNQADVKIQTEKL